MIMKPADERESLPAARNASPGRRPNLLPRDCCPIPNSCGASIDWARTPERKSRSLARVEPAGLSLSYQ